MFVIKGLLIFLPIFLFRLPFVKTVSQRPVAIAGMLVIFSIIISPYSFVGWFADYLIFFATATIALNALTANWRRTQLTVTRSLAFLFFVAI